MFKKVVWATDGSAAADEALEVATRMATEAGGEVVAVHCVEMTLPGKASGRYPVFADEDELSAVLAEEGWELDRRLDDRWFTARRGRG